VPDVKEALDRLQKERQIEVVIYQGSEDIRKYDRPARPTASAHIGQCCTRC